MKTMKIMALQLLLCLSYTTIQAQTINEQVYLAGTPMPDFTFNDVHHYKSSKVSLSDFKGKWLVLDYWSQYCGGCLKSMPKMDKLSKEFADKIQIIMVGDYPKGTLGVIKQIYEKIRKENNLNLTVAYDTLLGRKLGVYRLPDIFIVDPDGIIRGRTPEVTSEVLQSFLDGKIPHLEKGSYEKSQLADAGVKDPKRSLLFDRSFTSDTGYLVRSAIAKGTFEIPIYEKNTQGLIELYNRPLFHLYNLSVWGQANFISSDPGYDEIASEPILELRDSSLFLDYIKFSFGYQYPKELDKIDGVWKRDIRERPHVLKRLREDLADSFPYTATVEVRKVPCYRLIAHKDALKKLKTKGGDWQSASYHGASYVERNAFLFHSMWFIFDSSINSPKRLLLIDNTNIKDNVDYILTKRSFSELREEIKKYGLELVDSTVERKVLVIRDR